MEVWLKILVAIVILFVIILILIVNTPIAIDDELDNTIITSYKIFGEESKEGFVCASDIPNSIANLSDVKQEHEIRDLPQIALKITDPELDLTDYRAYNPSLFRYRDNIYYVYRISNFVSCPTEYFRTKLRQWMATNSIYSHIGIRTPRGNIIHIAAPNIISPSCAQGYEDARSFLLNNKLYLLTNARTDETCLSKMILLEIAIDDYDLESIDTLPVDRVIPLTITFDTDKHQKNWMPFVYDGELYLVYSVNPHTILHCDTSDGTCKIVYQSHNRVLPAGLRGGSQIQKWTCHKTLQQMYIGFAHIRYSDGYSTIPYAFEAKPPFRILKIGPEFAFNNKETFQNREIQFVSGFEIISPTNETSSDKLFYITYGQQDCESKLCIVSSDKVLGTLTTVDLSQTEITTI